MKYSPRFLLTQFDPIRWRAARSLLCFTALLGFTGIATSPLLAVERPNIIVFFADDMGYGDLQANNPQAKTRTPHLDQLAAAGLRFTDGHVNSSLCTPSRYGLLTGRYAWRTSLKQGVLRAAAPLLIDENCDTLASLLKRHGYHTAVIGKWHLGLGQGDDTAKKFSAAPAGLKPGPNERGFDYSFIIPASVNMSPLCYLKDLQPVNGVDGSASPPYAEWRVTRSNGRYPLPYGFDTGPVAPGIDPHYDTHPEAMPRYNKVLPRLTDEAVAYVDASCTQADRQPFFLYYPMPSPHTPWVPDIDTTGMSDEDVYIAYVNATDAAVGRVLEAIKRHGQWDNTLIFFSSDNGPELRHFNSQHSGHHPAGPWRGGKADLHEGGHRVPFIVSWPRHIPAGSTSAQLISTLDVYRTFATLLRDHRPAGLIGGEDSRDFSALFLGQPVTEPLRASLVSHSGSGRFAIRMGDWTYLDWTGSGGFLEPNRNPEGTPGQLFNLAADPAQTRNLYLEQPERVAAMKSALRDIQGLHAPVAAPAK